MKRPDTLITILDVYADVRLSAEDASRLRECIVYLESKLQPRKTVSDAVSAFPDGFSSRYNKVERGDYIAYCLEDTETGVKAGEYTDVVEKYCDKSKYQLICTREEFEAEVERRKGGEIFRLVGSSDLVKVVYEGRDGIVCVANEDNDIFVAKKEDLRKRKPIISKAEADAVKSFHDWAFARWAEGKKADVEVYLKQFEVK